MPVSVEYYRDKATQCCKKAAKTSDPIDKQAWTRLAVAWMALVELRDARHLPPSLGVSRGRYLAVLLAFCDGNRHRHDNRRNGCPRDKRSKKQAPRYATKPH